MRKHFYKLSDVLADVFYQSSDIQFRHSFWRIPVRAWFCFHNNHIQKLILRTWKHCDEVESYQRVFTIAPGQAQIGKSPIRLGRSSFLFDYDCHIYNSWCVKIVSHDGGDSLICISIGCDSFIWTDGNRILFEQGTLTTTTPAASGCIAH